MTYTLFNTSKFSKQPALTKYNSDLEKKWDKVLLTQ